MPDEHCRWCGRVLIDVVETDNLYDRATGERRSTVWRQCPNYPRNRFMAMFRGCHESFQRDHPIMTRTWQ